jgi:urease accessory protein
MQTHVQLHISTTEKGPSRLVSSYYNPPYKVADITRDKRNPELQLMLMSSSPGLLDQDEQTIHITLHPQAQLRLHTQSYQRLFTMRSGATQSMEVVLGPHAGFCWLPHPTVPHAGAKVKCRNRIYLHPTSRLIWGEILTCGRKGSGEIFRLDSYHSRTEVFIGEKLALMENQFLSPGSLPVNTLTQLGNHTHQASLITTINHHREDLDTCLAAQADIVSGITEGPAGILVIRLLGNGAEKLFHLLNTLAAILQSHPLCQPN